MMFKKIIKFIVIFITLFYLNSNISAYEFIDPNNKNIVNDRIEEVYNSKQQYEDLIGKEKKEDPLEIYGTTSDAYWWPIGSVEENEIDGKIFARGEPETINENSQFGYRLDPFGSGKTVFHSGLDIGGGRGLGQVNIIASKDGVVVHVTKGCISFGDSSCGGSYGNYIIIQHSDGNYTLYAHLHQETITVSKGDAVQQGQVIAKMGSSGTSTGAHLHFEVREGQNAYRAAVNPKNYISSENPRIIITSMKSNLLAFLHSWEGAPQQEGDDYIVFDDKYGTLTVGYGVTLKWHYDKFATRGVDVRNMTVGSKIPKSIVDEVESQILQSSYDGINGLLSNAGISLESYQIDALVSRNYNYNIDGFVDAYNKYGNTQELYDNYMARPVTSGGVYSYGLERRRKAEWTLFHTGKYNNNG